MKSKVKKTQGLNIRTALGLDKIDATEFILYGVQPQGLIALPTNDLANQPTKAKGLESCQEANFLFAQETVQRSSNNFLVVCWEEILY